MNGVDREVSRGALTHCTPLLSMGAVNSLLLSLGEESGQESLPERDFPEVLLSVYLWLGPGRSE